MLTRTVPKTGDQISILGYGCMRLPQENGKIDPVRATRQIRSAIDRGVNYIDTAYPYHDGQSEPFLGNALADGYREKVFLATKLAPWSVKTAADMDRLLDEQLSRLKTDHIDYYLIHALDGGIWPRMRDLGVREFLDRSIKAGKILHPGFSFHAEAALFREIIDAYDWALAMIQFNFFDEFRQATVEGVRYAAEKRIAVIAMEPMRGGNLARVVPPAVQAIWDRAETKRTPAEWAQRWVWNHPEITALISGMNEDAHIDENIRLAEQALPESLSDVELSLIADVRAEYEKGLKVECTGCGYCLPCPVGIDIPTVFDIYNHRYLFNDRPGTLWSYMLHPGGIMGEPGLASSCIACKKCEKTCPQNLPISDDMKKVAADFESVSMRMKVRFLRTCLDIQRWWKNLTHRS
jgi:uncharacterized protein